MLAGDRIAMGVDLVGKATAIQVLRCLSTTRRARLAALGSPGPLGLDVRDGVEVLDVQMKLFVSDPASAVYAAELTRLVAEGLVRHPELEVLGGGLEAVERGLERLKKGDLGGLKMVVDFDT